MIVVLAHAGHWVEGLFERDVSAEVFYLGAGSVVLRRRG
jgi:hypothetical protein